MSSLSWDDNDDEEEKPSLSKDDDQHASLYYDFPPNYGDDDESVSSDMVSSVLTTESISTRMNRQLDSSNLDLDDFVIFSDEG